MNYRMVMSFAFCLMFISASVINAISEQKEPEIVKGASYVVYDGSYNLNAIDALDELNYDACHEMTFIPKKSKYATFYTCDGERILTIEHDQQKELIENMLDKSSPKPQVFCYRIKYWPGIRGRVTGISRIFMGKYVQKAPSRYFVIFFDKDGNIIRNFCLKEGQIMKSSCCSIYKYKLRDQRLLKNYPLDLSQLK